VFSRHTDKCNAFACATQEGLMLPKRKTSTPRTPNVNKLGTARAWDGYQPARALSRVPPQGGSGMSSSATSTNATQSPTPLKKG